jgi:hypothetical protein
MSDPPLPNSASTGSGFVAILVVVILLTPIAALAAGTCAFVGMNIAVIGFGPESLGGGAGIGAAVGVLFVAAWAVLFVTRARASKEASQLHAEKLATYLQDMRFRVMKADSPVFRLLWALGLKVPPPLFLGAWGSFVSRSATDQRSARSGDEPSVCSDRLALTYATQTGRAT